MITAFPRRFLSLLLVALMALQPVAGAAQSVPGSAAHAGKARKIALGASYFGGSDLPGLGDGPDYPRETPGMTGGSAAQGGYGDDPGVLPTLDDDPTIDVDDYMSLNGMPPGTKSPEAPLSEPVTPGRVLSGRRPVVVELFTAQGCSACLPADRMLAALALQPDVLALAWHVDYWDYLGWPDALALPEHAKRQKGYASAAGERGIYTPQIIVDGQDTLLSLDRPELLALIDNHAARPPAIDVATSKRGSGHMVQLVPLAPVPGGVRILLVTYAPRRAVAIGAGENRGLTIDYANIVLSMQELSRWDCKAPLRLNVKTGTAGRPAADTRSVILVQQALRKGLPGPILAAVRLD